MSIEKTIQSLLEDAAKLKEANEVVPTKGTPEPSNAKNNVDDEPEAKGGTSKKANRATQGALPAETMAKLQAEAYDELTEDEMDLIESIDEETFEQLDELSKSTLGSYIKKAAANRGENALKHRALYAKSSVHNDTKVHRDTYNRERGLSKASDKIGITSGRDRQAVHRLKYPDQEQDPKQKERDLKRIDRLTKEDVEALFNGEDGLTEEFRQKAETIFEAAVTSRIKEEVARIEEAYEQRLEEALEEQIEGLVEHVDGYLNLMVKQWMENNEVALTSGLKSDILESFVGGLKNLFEQHYVDMPEEKFDVVAAMEAKSEDLNAKLDEAVAANVEMHKALSESVRAEIVAEACDGLSDLEAEKLQSLAEEIGFEDADSFANKIQTIRENYFAKTSAKPGTQTTILAEETILEEKSVPAEMQAYVKTISTLIR